MSYKVRVLPNRSLWVYCLHTDFDGFGTLYTTIADAIKSMYYLMKGYKIMKRNIFSVLLVCLMIVSVFVLSGCKTDELEAQINENASAAEGAVSDAISKAEDDVDAAAKEAAANLAAAQEELEKLIADGAAADAEALEAAVENFNAAIADVEDAMAAAEEAAKDNNDAVAAELAALKAELTTAVEDATMSVAGTAAQNLAAVKAELLAAIAESDKDSAADISAAVSEAVENLTALITTVQKTNMEYADSLKAELDNKFSAAIDDVAEVANEDLAAAVTELKALLAAAKVDSDSSYVSIEGWKDASDAAVAAAEELAKKYYAINRNLYYAEQLVELDVAYDTALVAVSRQYEVKAVADTFAAYVAVIDDIDTKADVIRDVLTANGETIDSVVHNDTWDKAIADAEEMLAAEAGDPDVEKSLEEVADLVEDFRNQYVALEGNADEAAKLNDRIAQLIVDIKDNGYTATTKGDYEALIANITAWNNNTNEANKVLLDNEALATLNENYAAAEAAYVKAAEDMKTSLGSITVYTYSADGKNLKAVQAIEDAYNEWVDDVEAAGFDLAGDVEKAVVDAHTAFADGVYARAQALEVAKAEADAIAAKIETLKSDINTIKVGGVVKSQYQADLLAIKKECADWIEEYFSGDYAAEAVAGNANYDLLAHGELAAVELLYNEVMKEIMDLAEALKVALAKIDNITIFSGADLNAAATAYTKFTDRLADLEYEIEGLDNAAGILKTLAEKQIEFDYIVKDAIADYAPVDKVTLSSGDALDALVDWYDNYFGLDLNDAEAKLPMAVVLGEITIDDKTVEDARAALAAFDYLTAEKAKEYKALTDELDALLKLNPSTALEQAVKDAMDHYNAWLDGTNAPENYDKEQFVPADPDALNDKRDALVAFTAEVAARIEALAKLKDRIADLVVDYKELDSADKQLAAKQTLEALLTDIEAFTKNNDNVDCFAEDAATIADAKLAIKLAEALTELTAIHDNFINVTLKDVEDTTIVAGLTDRANVALNAAIAAVKAAHDAANAEAEKVALDAIDLAYANFELFDFTVAEYLSVLEGVKSDAHKVEMLTKAYIFLDARADMTSAAQLQIEKDMVTYKFTAVLEDN